MTARTQHREDCRDPLAAAHLASVAIFTAEIADHDSTREARIARLKARAAVMRDAAARVELHAQRLAGGEP